MKIWIDILTPKQLLFSESIIEKLGKKHDILCTSREYGEVTKLAKMRNFDLVLVGKHGGGDKTAKLAASIERQGKLFRKIRAFSPDVTISSCSPEAARISFGLGIKHIAYSDTPHADAILRLTLPLIQKLLIPDLLPKSRFSKYGIDAKDIIPYHALDAVVTIKRKINHKKPLPFKRNKRRNILIRVEEEEASYISKSNRMVPIIERIVADFGKENIVILGRYPKQIDKLRKRFGKDARVVEMSFDGRHLLENASIFIGSGGTMTAESALLGVPTISYEAVPSIIENLLVKKGLVKREVDPKRISGSIKRILESPNNEHQKRAQRFVRQMDDPIQALVKVVKDCL